ncbi:hypothetical protein GLOIN_2v1871772 [Rhizophagus clarus]|uniref:Uncharacterized protein n=1 Tax=Rhizophagus clarus TaxID=94130 RepID=A0A8H3QTI0_9GLOM|nr:hypothetical protein GLOIN_2v1871772 [Rhizophagus clarus]
MPDDHADLPDLDMKMNQMHQSMTSMTDPPPSSSDTKTNSWKPEAASLDSSTASPDSTLDGQKPILLPPPSKPSASSKRSDESDDNTATLTMKKRKNESSTEDNNIIITGYQPEEKDKHLTLDLFLAAWSLSERKQREKFQAAITNIPEDMTIKSLFPEGTSGPFINKSNLQSFKIIREQDGTRILISYFTTWDALSCRLAKKQM